MCGIFGLLIAENLQISHDELRQLVNRLFKLSESRGKEASGLAVRFKNSIYVLKEPITSSRLVKTSQYKTLFSQTLKAEWSPKSQPQPPLLVLGHSRLQTNGKSEINANNQPVVKDGAVGIHNGIIVNDAKLWHDFPELKKKFDVDTEIFLSLLQMFRRQGKSLEEAMRLVFEQIEGSASVAVEFTDINSLVLASNTGSLYMAKSTDGKIVVFASEKFILTQILKNRYFQSLFAEKPIVQVKAGEGYLINLDSAERRHFYLNKPQSVLASVALPTSEVAVHELYDQQDPPLPDLNKYRLREEVKSSMMQSWENLYKNPETLKRCTRCLLPETMPYISFDEAGVCNYCHDYDTRGNYLKGEKALEEFIAPYRTDNGEPDVLIGFSGGRDSAFGLDYIKNTLKLNPITFTYDWGMVNDLARRNQARVVGKLGIEHIVISADIRTKRANIRKNLKAWLKHPDLGMVPILMAGDKQFYYYFHEVRKQTGVKLFIFCGGYEGEEGTGLFKYGFCNVTTQGSKNALRRMTGISKMNKMKMMYYYFKQFLKNPAYINRSMFDTLFAYYSSYVLKDDTSTCSTTSIGTRTK